MVTLSNAGLNYYQTYDWLFLRTIVSLGYMGWIVYSSLFILQTYVFTKIKVSHTSSRAVLKSNPRYQQLQSFSVSQAQHCCTLNSLLCHTIYTYCSLSFSGPRLSNNRHLSHTSSRLTLLSSAQSFSIHFVIYLPWNCWYISLTKVYSYFNRSVLSAWLALIGVLWPTTLPKLFKQRHTSTIFLWGASCLCTSVFTLLPVELEEDVRLMYLTK
jgi:GPI ethanolamine phosphate transferase 1